jgi:predicted PurR-regulated permease PerM
LDDQATRHLRSIDRTLRLAANVLLFAIFTWLLRDILLLAFAAVLVACILRGASDAVSHSTGLGPEISLAAVTIVLTSTFAAVLWLRGLAIADQAMQILQQLQTQIEHLWGELQTSSWGVLASRQLRDATNSLRGAITGYAPGVASSMLGIGGSIVVTMAAAAFLAASPQFYLGGSLRLLPTAWRPRARDVAAEVCRTLQLWFAGQLVDMVVVAVLLGIGLSLLGVKLAPTLALLAGLLNFVPYVGALAGAAPALLVALAQSPQLAVWVALLFVAVQLLEGNLIAPLIQKRTTSLAPALTIMSQTLLGSVFGILGLIIATPLTAAIVATVRMAYVESVLEADGSSQDEVNSSAKENKLK